MSARFIFAFTKQQRVLSSNLMGGPFSTSLVRVELLGVLCSQSWISTQAFPVASAEGLLDKCRQRETHVTHSGARGAKGTCLALRLVELQVCQ